MISTAEGLLYRNDPYAREVTSSAGNSVVREPGFDWGDAPYTMPQRDELILYELHVGTFNDAQGGRPGGFDSVVNRLDYLRDLGVNAIELMPSAEFATDFSWGYNPSQIFAIEEAYGGPGKLKELVRAAHQRGIAVIFDVVYNHFGPSDLDLWRFDGWGEDGGGGIYFYNDWRRQTPWGDTRPDYGRPEVRRYGGDAFARVVYTESHDEVANGHARLPEEIWPGNAASWPSKKRSTLGATLVFTVPGIPMLFQGQELLEDAWFRDEDPIDWTKEQTNAGIVRLYCDLIRLRRDRDGTTRGLRGRQVNVHHVNDADNVVAFHRWDRGGPRDDVVVVLNVAAHGYDAYRIGLPRPGRWRVRFNSDWSGYSADFGDHFSGDTATDGEPRDGMPASANVGIGPYTAVILSQDGWPAPARRAGAGRVERPGRGRGAQVVMTPCRS